MFSKDNMLEFTSKQQIEFISPLNPNYQVFMHEKDKDDERHIAWGIYAHGKMHKALGNDKLHIINVDKFESYILEDESEKIQMLKIPDGVYPAMVAFGGHGRAYVWSFKHRNSIIQKGLVVSANDEDAIKYAEEKYLKKSLII